MRYVKQLAFVVVFFWIGFAPTLFAQATKKIAIVAVAKLPAAGIPDIEKRLRASSARLDLTHVLDFKSFSFEGDRAKLPNLYQNILANYKPDLIYVTSAWAGEEAVLATKTTPIVFGIPSDPVTNKLIDQPGVAKANITGYTEYENLVPANVALIQSLFDTKPISNIALIHTEAIRDSRRQEYMEFEKSHNATIHEPQKKIKLFFVAISPIEPIAALSQKLREINAHAAVFFNDNGLNLNQQHFAHLSASLTIPSIINYRDMADKGALLHRVGNVSNKDDISLGYTQQILIKGSKPSELKVLGPNSYDIAVNETTTKKHGWVLDTRKVPGIRVVK
ncbi:MAG: hypothetical protein RLZZ502_1619 [Pseudomonadota bacterium]